jgi:serine/threonine protein kinase
MKQPTRKLDEKTTAMVTIQLCKALGYLHERKIIHRDIKPENILLDSQDNVKLADFGWSNFEEKFKKRETYCGTIDYLAPEMADHSHMHDHRVDIWSVGVLIYELLTGNAPFAPTKPGASNSEIELETKRNILKQKFDFPKDFPILAKDLVKKILVLKPEDRLTIEQILSHPWLSRFFEESPDKQRIQRTFTVDSQNSLAFSQFLKQTVQLEEVHKEGSYYKNEFTFNPDELDRFVKPESVVLRSDLHFTLPLSNLVSANSGPYKIADKPRDTNYDSKGFPLGGGSPTSNSSPIKPLMTGALSPPTGPNPYSFANPSGGANFLMKPAESGNRSNSQQKAPVYLEKPQAVVKAQSRGNSPPRAGPQSYSTAATLPGQSPKQTIPPLSPQTQSQTQSVTHYGSGLLPPQKSATQSQPQTSLLPKATPGSQAGAKTSAGPGFLLPPERALQGSVTGLPVEQAGEQLRDRGEASLGNARPSKGRPSLDDWGFELLRAKERVFELSQEVRPAHQVAKVDNVRHMNRVLENQRDVLRDRELAARNKYQKAVDELNRIKAENEEIKGRLAITVSSKPGGDFTKEQENMLVKLKMLTELVENLKYFKTELDQVVPNDQEREESRRLREQNEQLRKQLAVSTNPGINEATKVEFLQGIQRLNMTLENLSLNVGPPKPADLRSYA